MCCNCTNECNMDFGVGGSVPDLLRLHSTHIENDRQALQRKLIYYKKAAERHGGAEKVVVGQITDFRVNLSDKRIYIEIKTYVKDDGFEGVRKAEGFIEASSVSEIAAISNSIFIDRPVVIDIITGEVIELLTCDIIGGF